MNLKTPYFFWFQNRRMKLKKERQQIQELNDSEKLPSDDEDIKDNDSSPISSKPSGDGDELIIRGNL